MARLDETLNQQAAWADRQQAMRRRIEVDLREVEHVIELALRTPGLRDYNDELRQLSIFFQIASAHYQQNAPNELADLVAFWERYRAAVVQRYTGITPVELRAADRVVHNIFDRFLKNVPNDRIAYARDAKPLVYGGEGGLGAYFTHPPGWNRSFAIINLPHAAFDNVWQWLALPHETGHDLYATIDGLSQELQDALASRMEAAVQNSEVAIPDVDVDLAPYGVPYRIQYTGAEFLATLWRGWANEAQADIVGLLTCGGAAAVALQTIIGFAAEDHWFLSVGAGGGIADGPEPHPTSYVRNALNIEALRRIGGGHQDFADEIEQRFQALRPQGNSITWRIGDAVNVAEVSAREMLKSAKLAAEVLVDQPLAALGDKSYAQLAIFDDVDQALVDAMVDPLIGGDPTFAQSDHERFATHARPVEPRHALASTMLAFEKDRQAGNIINRTFKHFV